MKILFLLFLNCFCSDDDIPDNLTEICINPLKGDCHGVFEIQTISSFEKYCLATVNLTIYLINNYITGAFFNMFDLNSLRQCNIIGLSNSSRIYIVIDLQKSQNIDFKAENVIIDFSSLAHNNLIFKTLVLNNTTINSYASEISARNIESDLYSLSSSVKFSSQIFIINSTIPPKNPISISLNLYTVYFGSNELKINLFGLSDDFLINLNSSVLALGFVNYDTLIEFNVNAIKASFILNYTSSSSNFINISTFTQLKEDNNWVSGIYQLGVFHSGNLSIDLSVPNFFFGQLSVNQLNLTSTVKCLCKVFKFESSMLGQFLLCDIGENITVDLYNDFNANTVFLGQGQVNIVSDFNVDHFKKMYFDNLSFASNYASIKVDVTRNQKEALIIVKGNFNFLNDIVMYPIYNESKFSLPDDIDSILGKTLLTFCAPNADIEAFDVRSYQDTDSKSVPPGFTSDAMSFSLQQNQNCISLVFAKDPRSFSTEACIYQTDSSLCENITELSYDASKGETPFNDEISTQYINIIIAEDLPKDYFLNLSQLTGKHEIHITSLSSENDSLSENLFSTSSFDKYDSQLREINIVDLRSDTTETSLILDRINAHFEANMTEYERIYLTSGSKIINDIDLRNINSLELDFDYSEEYDRVLYECENVKLRHVSVDEIIYEKNEYIFVKKGNKISLPNNHTYTLSFDTAISSSSQVKIYIRTYDVKPLILCSDTTGPLIINFINLTGQTPTTLTAIQLQVDSSSDISFLSPTYNIPVEIIGLKDSSTFEKMKRITVYSESNIVDRGFYPTSFTIREDNVSFIAFSPSSLRSIPSLFSEIDIFSDTYIISVFYEKEKHNFGNISFITSDLKIGYGVKATLIYGMVLKSITIYDNSELNLFHVPIRNTVSIDYHIILGQKPSIINLAESQNDLDIPSKTPFYIEKDTDPFLPQIINIEHKLPHKKNLNIFDSDNDTVEYCILLLKSTDRCDQLANLVKFDPSELPSADGYYTFKSICKPQCLAISSEFHKNDSKTTSSHKFDTRNIIIIASLSGVLLIALIIIVVLVVKRKQNPNDYMKSLLLTLPSDM